MFRLASLMLLCFGLSSLGSEQCPCAPPAVTVTYPTNNSTVNSFKGCITVAGGYAPDPLPAGSNLQVTIKDGCNKVVAQKNATTACGSFAALLPVAPGVYTITAEITGTTASDTVTNVTIK